jgi:competence protein ComEA
MSPMLRFTALQVGALSVLLFLLGFGSYRLHQQRLAQAQLAEELLGSGIELLPATGEGTASGKVAAPIERLAGEELLALREQMKIDINTADVAKLTHLPGIGPATAQRILEYRNENGPFASIDDLTKVSRIGPKLLEKFRDQITVGHSETVADAAPSSAPDAPEQPEPPQAATQQATRDAAPPAAAAAAAPAAAPRGRLDINTASAAQLETLPRIGPATAKAIIDFRKQHGPFRSIEELVRVPRIGPKTLENLRGQITVSGSGDAASAAPQSASRPAAAASKPAASGRGGSSGGSGQLAAGQKININTASEADLTRLPGVGPATAQKIAEHRSVHGPFARIEDILKIKGIGKAKFEQMREHLSVQ